MSQNSFPHSGQPDLADSMIEPLLDSGEKLLWCGQPKPGLRLQANDFFLIPFSLLWCGFVIFWEAGAMGMFSKHDSFQLHRTPTPVLWFFPLFGIPFILIGLYLVFGRFFFDAAMRKKTYYAITSRRLIVLKVLFNRNVISYDYKTLPDLNLTERSDSSGDIFWGSYIYPNAFAGQNWPSPAYFSRYRMPGFYAVPNARAIYNQIRAAQAASK